MSTLTNKQIETAKQLLKKHNKKVIYVIAKTGQMYFSKNNAEITAKGKEVVGVGDGEVDDEQLTAAALNKLEEKPEEVENIEPAATGEVKEAAADVPVKKAEATLPRIKNKK